MEIEEEARPKSRLEKQLDIDTHEDIGDVEERAKGPRTLRSGRELHNVTWNLSDLHVALLMHRGEEEINEVKNEKIEEEPTTFEEAWYHNDLESRRKWREAIGLEFKNMKKRIVWLKMLKAKKPEGRTLVKSKWVFKIKRNGTYRARLVACGYS